MKRIAVFVAAAIAISVAIQAATFTTSTLAIPASTTKVIPWLTPNVTGVTVTAVGGLRLGAITDPSTNVLISTDASVTGIIVMSSWSYVYTGGTAAVQYDYTRISDSQYKDRISLKNTNASGDASCTLTLATE